MLGIYLIFNHLLSQPQQNLAQYKLNCHGLEALTGLTQSRLVIVKVYKLFVILFGGAMEVNYLGQTRHVQFLARRNMICGLLEHGKATYWEIYIKKLVQDTRSEYGAEKALTNKLRKATAQK